MRIEKAKNNLWKIRGKSKKVLYHITTKDKLEKILKEGIKPPENSFCVYLTDMPLIWLKTFAKERGQKEFVVLQVEIPIIKYIEKLGTDSKDKKGVFVDFDFDEFSMGLCGQIRYNGTIPKEWITSYYIVNFSKIEIFHRKALKYGKKKERW